MKGRIVLFLSLLTLSAKAQYKLVIEKSEAQVDRFSVSRIERIGFDQEHVNIYSKDEDFCLFK